MFTAIVFTALGLALFQALGWMDAEEIFVPPPYLWAAAAGGALVGAGFAVAGAAPVTSGDPR